VRTIEFPLRDEDKTVKSERKKLKKMKERNTVFVLTLAKPNGQKVKIRNETKQRRYAVQDFSVYN